MIKLNKKYRCRYPEYTIVEGTLAIDMNKEFPVTCKISRPMENGSEYISDMDFLLNGRMSDMLMTDYDLIEVRKKKQ
jgi:hypothetical protein